MIRFTNIKFWIQVKRAWKTGTNAQLACGLRVACRAAESTAQSLTVPSSLCLHFHGSGNCFQSILWSVWFPLRDLNVLSTHLPSSCLLLQVYLSAEKRGKLYWCFASLDVFKEGLRIWDSAKKSLASEEEENGAGGGVWFMEVCWDLCFLAKTNCFAWDTFFLWWNIFGGFFCCKKRKNVWMRGIQTFFFFEWGECFYGFFCKIPKLQNI